jgi:small subunit ribosomal protein S20
VANHKSAAKRARQTPKRRDRNRAIRSRVRSAVKGFLAAVEGGDADAARTCFRSAERELRKAASHGVLPKGQVSRKVSRLARRLHA